MPVLDLSAYKPVPATLGDANQIANGFQAIQNAINALDQNNFAAGLIFDPAKLMQDAAVQGQGLVWNGSIWAPAGVCSRIADVTLGGSAASFDFTSIPQTFAHLMLVLEGRGDTAAAATTVALRANNDSGANYESANSYMNGAAAFSGTGTGGGVNALILGHMPAATASASATGNLTLILAHYTAATLWRRWSGTGGADDGTNIWLETFMGAWRNAAAAINRLTITPGAGNFVAGSRATLYGLG